MQTLIKITLSILVVCILVVGYFVYAGVVVISIGPLNSQQNNLTNEEKPAASTEKDSKFRELISLFSNPPTDQTQKENFNLKIRAASVESNVLDITGCKPNPQIITVRLNKPFTVKNSDTVERRITHTQFSIAAPANTERSVTPNFSGEGSFGYRCGGELVGIIYVIPQQ